MAIPPHPLLAALICPDDGGSVAYQSPAGVVCMRCGRVFVVEGNLLSMLPSGSDWDPRTTADVLAERRQRDLEAAAYDRLLGLRMLSPWEIPATLRPLRLTGDNRVLEVGCGTGRFSEIIARQCRELIAVDHSLSSLRILERKLSASLRKSVLLIQGDATRLPIRTAWADRALSCQMLEHLPGVAVRERALAELARTVEPGGRLAISAYWHTPGLGWLLKREGKHSGEIYFHRFRKDELRALLDARFELESMTGRLIYLLLAHLRRR